MKNTLLLTAFIFRLLNPLLAQSEILVSTDFLSAEFETSYVISHTPENTIFDAVRINGSEELPEFINLKVPGSKALYSVSFLVSSIPEDTTYYARLVNAYTIWDNRKDTIAAVAPPEYFNRSLIRDKATTHVRISNLKKLDHIYSLSLRKNLQDDLIHRTGNIDVELEIDGHPELGRCLYVVGKKDDDYREIVIPPSTSESYESVISTDYRNLPVHTNRVTLDISTAYRAFLQINANTTNGDIYRLYTSPPALESFDELTVDLPVSLDTKDYNVSIILRDFDSSSEGIIVTSSGQKVKSLQDFRLPALEDISNAVTISEQGYRVNLVGKSFDKWSLIFNINGLLDTPGSRVYGENIVSNNWLISGNVNSDQFEVFLPRLTSEIENAIFGSRGYVADDEEKWSFTRQVSADNVEVSSFQRY